MSAASTEIRYVVAPGNYNVAAEFIDAIAWYHLLVYGNRKTRAWKTARRRWRRKAKALGLNPRDVRARMKMFRARVPVVFTMTETVRGKGGPVARGNGLKLIDKTRTRLGRIGAHNEVEVSEIHRLREPIDHVALHALHKGTVGKVAAWLYLRALAALVGTFDGEWAVAGDINHSRRALARLLGGKAYGDGVTAVILSRGQRGRLETVDDTGVRMGWTDHKSIVVRASLAGAR